MKGEPDLIACRKILVLIHNSTTTELFHLGQQVNTLLEFILDPQQLRSSGQRLPAYPKKKHESSRSLKQLPSAVIFNPTLKRRQEQLVGEGPPLKANLVGKKDAGDKPKSSPPGSGGVGGGRPRLRSNQPANN